jgi:hypothetical protein
MKLSVRVSALVLTCASVVAAQTRAQDTPPKTQEAPKTQETAPAPPATQTTVTESKVPVAGHPVASPKEVKNLYIEPMVNELDLYLKAEFLKQLAGRIVIVSKPEDADAVMTGIGEWHNGTAQAVTGRGAVQMLSKGSLLWASEAWGLLKSGTQRKVAGRIVHSFKNVIEEEPEERWPTND